MRSGEVTRDGALGAPAALAALVRCATRTAGMIARRHLHQPDDQVGQPLRFADGTTSSVYRETRVDRPPATAPAVLVVGFQLRRVRGEREHALFRLESVLNTILFAGFPGFVSKLWLRHDESGRYRGLYQWDGSELALDYVRALGWVLALVSVPGSIRYAVLPGLQRDELLADPSSAPALTAGWWRPVASQK